MKTLFPSIVALLFFSLISAQVTQIASGLNSPQRLLSNNNFIYFTDATSVFKFESNENPATPVLVLDGLNNPTGMLLDGNTLYIADRDGNKIVKIDITQPNPIAENVLTGISTPTDLALFGNYLFYSQYSGNRIGKVDVTSSTPTDELVIQNLLAPSGLALKGNFLYYSEPVLKKVGKIDITLNHPTPIPVIPFISAPVSIDFRGDELYITSRNGHFISKYNIVTGESSNVLSGLNLPLDVAFSSNILFFVNSGDNSIYKAEGILGTNKSNLTTSIKLFPNPAQSFLKITNILEETTYTINTLNGAQIASGIYLPDTNISLEGLTPGVYFIHLKNNQSLKFIKN